MDDRDISTSTRRELGCPDGREFGERLPLNSLAPAFDFLCGRTLISHWTLTFSQDNRTVIRATESGNLAHPKISRSCPALQRLVDTRRDGLIQPTRKQRLWRAFHATPSSYRRLDCNDRCDP